MTGNPHHPPQNKKQRRGGKPQGGPAQYAAPEEEQDEDGPKHTVGKTLRQGRVAAGLSLEDVSSAINVRVAQLQSIENDRIDQLPGMTYAVGFVRSYAQYLKLDTKDLVNTFKEEHAGEDAAKTALNFTDPIGEEKLPGPKLIGAAVCGIVILVLVWSLLSSDDEGEDLVSNIPPAPVVGTASGQPTLADSQPLAGYQTGVIMSGSPGAEGTELPPANVTGAVVGTAPADTAAAPAAAGTAPQAASAVQEADVGQMVVRPAIPAPRPDNLSAPVLPQQEVINVKRGKARVVIEANQKSWVQVVDANGKTLFKKVMAAGEQYYVPDQKGVTLITSNAGGLNIIVDGAKVQELGKPGEILRGIQMDPEELKKKRVRIR